jgi:hypothetical protein
LTDSTIAADRPAPEAQGLKAGAISFLDATVFGLASTAPAYSLAAVISWVTRALGPWPGWLGGWAVCTTGSSARIAPPALPG